MRRLLRRIAAAAFFLVALSVGFFAVAAQSLPRGYQIIRNPSNPVDAVDRQFLEDAFLKKKTAWPDGAVIRPVDLAPASTARRQFSDDVLRRPVDAIRSYWQQRIFAGRELPPPEFSSDAEVVRFVLRERGAVGYVSSAATLNGARPLTIK
jgi:hypothetical protein